MTAVRGRNGLISVMPGGSCPDDTVSVKFSSVPSHVIWGLVLGLPSGVGSSQGGSIKTPEGGADRTEPPPVAVIPSSDALESGPYVPPMATVAAVFWVTVVMAKVALIDPAGTITDAG